MAHLYEHYNTGDDDYGAIYPPYWAAQTFTVGAVGHKVTSIKLKLLNYVCPSGTLTVSIRATYAGKPTGADLTSGTIANGSIGSAAYYTIAVTEYFLQPNTMYAIVVRDSTGGPGGYIAWYYDGSSPTYAYGTGCDSADGGSTWTIRTDTDWMFEVWGPDFVIVTETSPSGLNSPYGGGTYVEDTVITIGVSTVSGYTFLHWDRDGIFYIDQLIFNYTVENNRTFTAIFRAIEGPVAFEMRRQHKFFDDFRGAYISSSWNKVGTVDPETGSYYGIAVFGAANSQLRFTDAGGLLTELFNHNSPWILLVRCVIAPDDNAFIVFAAGDPATSTNACAGFYTVAGRWRGICRAPGGATTYIDAGASVIPSMMIFEYMPGRYVRCYYNGIYVGQITTNLPSVPMSVFMRVGAGYPMKIDYISINEMRVV